MKSITQQDIEIVKGELANKRKEFEELGLSGLEEKLEWIRKFFNTYIPELEKRYMSEEELKEWKFLPNELRIQFYMYFPEHGLNMANYSQDLVYELAEERRKNQGRRFDLVNRSYFSHYDWVVRLSDIANCYVSIFLTMGFMYFKLLATNLRRKNLCLKKF